MGYWTYSRNTLTSFLSGLAGSPMHAGGWNLQRKQVRLSLDPNSCSRYWSIAQFADSERFLEILDHSIISLLFIKAKCKIINIYQKQLVLICFSVLFQVNNSNRLAELCGIPRDKKISSLECRCAIVISGLEKEVLAAEDPPLTPDEQQLTDFYECTLEEFPRPVIQLPIWTKFRKWGWGFSPSDGY